MTNDLINHVLAFAQNLIIKKANRPLCRTFDLVHENELCDEVITEFAFLNILGVDTGKVYNNNFCAKNINPENELDLIFFSPIYAVNGDSSCCTIFHLTNDFCVISVTNNVQVSNSELEKISIKLLSPFTHTYTCKNFHFASRLVKDKGIEYYLANKIQCKIAEDVCDAI